MAVSGRQKVAVTVVGAVGVASVIGLGTVAPSFAFTGQRTAAVAAATPSPNQRSAEQPDRFAAALAKELGIDKATVVAALTKIRAEREAAIKDKRLEGLKSRLDAAVTAGDLTREQADAITKAVESGVFPFGGDMRHHDRFGGGKPTDGPPAPQQ
jgi:carboxylesterase type B